MERSDYRINASPYSRNTHVNDIDAFFDLRCKNENNPIFAYYNINHFRNKIIDNVIKYILDKCLPDIFVVSETKLDASFTNAQFLIDNYLIPERSDVSKHSGGLIEYVRKGIIYKRLHDFELTSFESIASEFTITKNNWFLLSFYRTERNENRGENIRKFFSELTMLMTSVTRKYENIILMGDINIDFNDKKCCGFKEFRSFNDILGLKNLIKEDSATLRGTNLPSMLFLLISQDDF